MLASLKTSFKAACVTEQAHCGRQSLHAAASALCKLRAGLCAWVCKATSGQQLIAELVVWQCSLPCDRVQQRDVHERVTLSHADPDLFSIQGRLWKVIFLCVSSHVVLRDLSVGLVARSAWHADRSQAEQAPEASYVKLHHSANQETPPA